MPLAAPQAQSPTGFRAAAGIVTYHPDFDDLAALVAGIAPDAATIAIFANSPVPEIEAVRLRLAAGASRLHILDPGKNQGLGVAYDALLDQAEADGAEFLLLLDQDSTPTPQMIPRLVAAYLSLAGAGARVALVGPQPLDPAGKPIRLHLLRGAPNTPDQTMVPVQFAISSGSLLRIDAARAIGGFRADFFIDAIDVEWCMRANHLGYSVWVARDVLMPHRLGRGSIRLPGGLRLTDQPPLRLYTYLRNQIAMMRLAHVPFRHKAGTALSFPVRLAAYLRRNRFSSESRAAMLNGIADGLRNRLGPPDHATESRLRRARDPGHR